MLPKKNRLASEKDFQTIYRHGMKYRGKYGMLIALPPRSSVEDFPSRGRNSSLAPDIQNGVAHETVGNAQFGFVVSKKIGNAVVRHKMARWLRNIVMEQMRLDPGFAPGYKFSYVAYEMPEDFSLFKEELRRLFSRVSE